MTFQRGQIVLVDTNVIIESHRIGCWDALAECFSIHTVEKVIEETQTGSQNRRPQQVIDEAALRASMRHIAPISELDIAAFNLEHQHPGLDDGERDLMIYAGTIAGGAWLLNSPDMASLRFASSVGWLDRMVSLGAMTSAQKIHLRQDMRDNYSEKWLGIRKTNLIMGLL